MVHGAQEWQGTCSSRTVMIADLRHQLRVRRPRPRLRLLHGFVRRGGRSGKAAVGLPQREIRRDRDEWAVRWKVAKPSLPRPCTSGRSRPRARNRSSSAAGPPRSTIEVPTCRASRVDRDNEAGTVTVTPLPNQQQVPLHYGVHVRCQQGSASVTQTNVPGVSGAALGSPAGTKSIISASGWPWTRAATPSSTSF